MVEGRPWDNDILFVNADIELSFWERVRVLFGAAIRVESKAYTEYNAGNHIGKSNYFVGRKRECSSSRGASNEASPSPAIANEASPNQPTKPNEERGITDGGHTHTRPPGGW